MKSIFPKEIWCQAPKQIGVVLVSNYFTCHTKYERERQGGGTLRGKYIDKLHTSHLPPLKHSPLIEKATEIRLQDNQTIRGTSDTYTQLQWIFHFSLYVRWKIVDNGATHSRQGGWPWTGRRRMARSVNKFDANKLNAEAELAFASWLDEGLGPSLASCGCCKRQKISSGLQLIPLWFDSRTSKRLGEFFSGSAFCLDFWALIELIYCRQSCGPSCGCAVN